MSHHQEDVYQDRLDIRLHWQPCQAMRQALQSGYRWNNLRSDLMAGLVVGTVALPLSMALAIASGVPPQHGLYTAAIAGALIAILGGSALQVSGPTAAFVVVLAPIAAKFGIHGLLLATMLAGALLVMMGLVGMGKLIRFIPYPVVTGFTAGIAVVIATLQINDFLGLHIEHMPETYLARVRTLVLSLPAASPADTAIGVLTLGILIGFPKLTRRIPAPVVALPVATLLAIVCTKTLSGFDVATIGSRFGGIPGTLPTPILPWTLSAPDASAFTIQDLLGPAFAIAILGAIESLLSAVVADSMTSGRHDSDAELVAQGIGNIVVPFFGGIAATGALARTATNIRAGGQSPLASVFHALFIVAVMLLFAPWLSLVPMASLAALLLVVAWNMCEIKHMIRVLRSGLRSDAFVLLLCFGLTVIFDMVVSVSIGVVLAAMLFMRRMADLAAFRLMTEDHPGLSEPLPKGVLLYEISGPMFFGAAQKAVSAISTIASDIRVVLLDLRNVPTMDSTGLVNLESALDALRKADKFVVLAGVQRQPLHLMAKAGWEHHYWLVVLRSFEESVMLARMLAPGDYETAAEGLAELVHQPPSTEAEHPRKDEELAEHPG